MILMEELPDLSGDDYVVKSDLELLRKDMTHEFESVRTDMAHEFESVRTDMAHEFQLVRKDMQLAISEGLRTQMVTLLSILIPSFIAIAGLMLGGMKLLMN